MATVGSLLVKTIGDRVPSVLLNVVVVWVMAKSADAQGFEPPNVAKVSAGAVTVNACACSTGTGKPAAIAAAVCDARYSCSTNTYIVNVTVNDGCNIRVTAGICDR